MEDFEVYAAGCVAILSAAAVIVKLTGKYEDATFVSNIKDIVQFILGIRK